VWQENETVAQRILRGDVVSFKLDGIIKGILYNKDGTVEYVFDDAKLNQVIAPLTNNSSESDENEQLFLSNSKNFEVSFESTNISKDALYLLGILHWYDWWNGDKIKYDFEVNI
jgi:hypothetical protein